MAGPETHKKQQQGGYQAGWSQGGTATLSPNATKAVTDFTQCADNLFSALNEGGGPGNPVIQGNITLGLMALRETYGQDQEVRADLDRIINKMRW